MSRSKDNFNILCLFKQSFSSYRVCPLCKALTVRQAFIIFLIEVSINYKFCMVILVIIKHYLGRKMILWEVFFLTSLTFYGAFFCEPIFGIP